MAEDKIHDIRKDYGILELSENNILDNPFDQFEVWFKDAMRTEGNEVNACVLSTLDKDNIPEGRVVLLKYYAEDGFSFYTNYGSQKAQQLAKHPYASMTFYWRTRERQVRIKGSITKVPEEISDAYFEERPEGSRIGAWASPQSQEIPNRQYLENKVEEIKHKYQKEGKIPRPEFWGGYLLQPSVIEFWQGRSSRLHDRIVYTLEEDSWVTKRIAP